jgi:putative mRNA 3-end processing factor
MLIMTENGLYCPLGDFYIDPKRKVNRSVITHAHSDHARKGSKQYYCTTSGADLLKARLGENISLLTFDYRKKFHIGHVEISFYPAGHILGSSQVRLEVAGEVWVVSGDYKREYDPTCEPFESVACDVFISEATFGTPSFSWNKTANFGAQIYQWWLKNQDEGFNSLLFAYSLGKAQRILGALQSFATKPIYCHPATEQLNVCYRKQGINLAQTICLNNLKQDSILSGDLILTPSSFLKTNSKINLGKYKTAFASGWMKRNSNQYDTGFIMSDHADWQDLLLTIQQSGAKQVFVQHRGSGALVKKLNSLGIKAYPDSALFSKSPNQLVLF